MNKKFNKIAFLTFFTAFALNAATKPKAPAKKPAMSAEMLMQKAITLYKSAKEFKNVEKFSEDCLISTMVANKGKCTLGFKIDGKEVFFLASPEVASPYMFSYSMSNTPSSELDIFVAGKEVLSIKHDDQVISKKLDFTR